MRTTVFNDDLWAIWDGKNDLVLGMCSNGEIEHADKGLFLVVGHKDGARTNVQTDGQILGVFELQANKDMRLAIILPEGIQYLEILSVQSHTLVPRKTFELLRGGAKAPSNPRFGYAVLSIRENQTPTHRKSCISYETQTQRISETTSKNIVWLSRFGLGETCSDGNHNITGLSRTELVVPGVSAPLFLTPIPYINMPDDHRNPASGISAVQHGAGLSRIRQVHVNLSGQSIGDGPEGIILVHISRQSTLADKWRSSEQLPIPPAVQSGMISYASRLFREAWEDYALAIPNAAAPFGAPLNVSDLGIDFAALTEQRVLAFEAAPRSLNLRSNTESPWVTVMPAEQADGSYDISVGGIAVGDHLIFFDMHSREIAAPGSAAKDVQSLEIGLESLLLRADHYTRSSPELNAAYWGNYDTDNGNGTLTRNAGSRLTKWLEQFGDSQRITGLAPVFIDAAQLAGIDLKDEHQSRQYSENPAACLLAQTLFNESPLVAGPSANADDGIVSQALAAIGCGAALTINNDLLSQTKALIYLWNNKGNASTRKALQCCENLTFDNSGTAGKNNGDISTIVEKLHELDRYRGHTDFLNFMSNNADAMSLLNIDTQINNQRISATKISALISEINTLFSMFNTVKNSGENAVSGTPPDPGQTSGDLESLKQYKGILEKRTDSQARTFMTEFESYFSKAETHENLQPLLLARIRAKFKDLVLPENQEVTKLADSIRSANTDAVFDKAKTVAKLRISWELTTKAKNAEKEILQQLKQITNISEADRKRGELYSRSAAVLNMEKAFNKCESIAKKMQDNNQPIPTELRRRLSIWPQDCQVTYQDFRALDKARKSAKTST